jgi:hypothetical protein
MAQEEEPSLPESFWNALRRQRPNERAVDHAYFRFTMAHSFRRPPPRVIHYLVFGFVAGVAAVSAAASGRYWLLQWLPLVPHESRASGANPWRHQHPTGTACAVPSTSSSAPALVNELPGDARCATSSPSSSKSERPCAR